MDEAKSAVCQDLYTQINSMNNHLHAVSRVWYHSLVLVSHYSVWVFLLCGFSPFSICDKKTDRKTTKKCFSTLTPPPPLFINPLHLGQSKWSVPSIVLQLRLLRCPGWSGTCKSLCELCYNLANANPRRLMASQYIMSLWAVIGSKCTSRHSNIPLKFFMCMFFSFSISNCTVSPLRSVYKWKFGLS